MHYTQIYIFQMFVFFVSVSQKIRILNNTKKYFYECWPTEKNEHENYEHVQHSVLGAPFAWIAAAMWCVMESISLWHCSGVTRDLVTLIVAFSSSELFGLVCHIFLLIPHSLFVFFLMAVRSDEFAGQLRIGILCSLNQVLVNGLVLK